MQFRSVLDFSFPVYVCTYFNINDKTFRCWHGTYHLIISDRIHPSRMHYDYVRTGMCVDYRMHA